MRWYQRSVVFFFFFFFFFFFLFFFFLSTWRQPSAQWLDGPRLADPKEWDCALSTPVWEGIAHTLCTKKDWQTARLPARLPAKHPSSSRQASRTGSLLLATGGALLLALARDHLAQHADSVAVHEGHAGQALAILEGVGNQRLLRLEAALGHLVGLQGVGILQLLAAGLLAHLPLQCGDSARRASASHETNRGVANLDLVGDVEDLDLCVKLTSLAQGGVLLVDHHISRAGHVVLVQTLDVEAHIVAGVGEVHPLMVHLDSEHLARARVGGGVGGKEDDLLTRLHDALLDTSGQHITDTLDLVDAGDGHAHGGADRSL